MCISFQNAVVAVLLLLLILLLLLLLLLFMFVCVICGLKYTIRLYPMVAIVIHYRLLCCKGLLHRSGNFPFSFL